jgi:hypothetical protein
VAAEGLVTTKPERPEISINSLIRVPSKSGSRSVVDGPTTCVTDTLSPRATSDDKLESIVSAAPETVMMLSYAGAAFRAGV